MDNRNIFIIGNGFDLSQGINSGYKHFVNWTISNFFKQFQIQPSNWGDYLDKDFSNEFIFFRLNYKDRYKDFHFQSENCNFYKAVPRILSKIENLDEFRIKTKEIEEYSYSQVKMNLQAILKYNFDKNLVFNKIIEEYDKNKNWADIEKLYFKLLMKENGTEKLNSDFEVLKNKFEEYLKSLGNGIPIPKYKDFFSKFVERDIGFNLVLNFNYTNTFSKYIPDYFQVLNIHGELDNEDNKIIFGYGDYESEDYKRLEALDDNKKLKHIKLFNYNLSDNYEKLSLRLGQLFSVHILT